MVEPGEPLGESASRPGGWAISLVVLVRDGASFLGAFSTNGVCWVWHAGAVTGLRVDGLLLAAGEGRRMGRPKALVVDEDGTPWLHTAALALRGGGCRRLVIVLGAAAEEAALVVAQAPLDHEDVHVVVAADWAEGMGASLRTGLGALDDRADAVVVTLVDLPDVTSAVVRRVLEASTSTSDLARAAYDGQPGHPVLLGRDHWDRACESATGDRGAREYLAAHAVTLVECGDLATGRDVDSPPPPRTAKNPAPTGDQRRAK